VGESRHVSQRGSYESRFVRAVDPDAPRAIWIRQTSHRAPGGLLTVAAWCTVFAADGPRAVKQSGSAPTARLDDAGAGGAAEAEGHSAEWALAFAQRDPPLYHLPRRWLYRAPLPRTKLESPEPGVRVTGHVEVDGRRVELDGWPGTTGHNWGTEHAARWVWLHGIAFPDAPGAWLDVAIGRVRLGPVLTPWVANGAVRLEDATRVPIGGFGRSALVQPAPGRLDATLAGPGGARLVVEAVAPLERTVAFSYRDPSGGGHDVLNCSIASLHARLERRDAPPLSLRTEHGGACELGLPGGEALGVALQPYPDP
jgi:hypothetical protein